MVQGRQIIIGDVHGQYDALVQLLEQVSPSVDDQVYFLGDVIDRGPKSAQVLDLIHRHGYKSLLGNHEQMMLAAFPNDKAATSNLAAWLYSGGQATLESFDSVHHLLKQLPWIRTWPTYLDLGNIWLVHAGVNPLRPLDKQTLQDLCWIRQPFHGSRSPYFQDKLIVAGHTITFTLPDVVPGGIAQGEGWLNIDTGAYHPRSGWLTGVDVSNEVVYQANVYTKVARCLPLAEVVVKVNPAMITGPQPLIKFAG